MIVKIFIHIAIIPQKILPKISAIEAKRNL